MLLCKGCVVSRKPLGHRKKEISQLCSLCLALLFPKSCRGTTSPRVCVCVCVCVGGGYAFFYVTHSKLSRRAFCHSLGPCQAAVSSRGVQGHELDARALGLVWLVLSPGGGESSQNLGEITGHVSSRAPPALSKDRLFLLCPDKHL